QILSELELPDPRPAEWEERIRAVVMAWAGLQDRHPRAFPLVYRRRPPDTWNVTPTEEIFDALRSAGFDEVETANAYLTLIFLLDGALMSRPFPFSNVRRGGSARGVAGRSRAVPALGGDRPARCGGVVGAGLRARRRPADQGARAEAPG